MTAYDFMVEYNKSKGWGTTDEDIYEVLLDKPKLWEDRVAEHRWWDEYFYVVNIDGTLIGFVSAQTTGDMSAREAGWEFDIDSICYVKPVEVVTTIYERVE